MIGNFHRDYDDDIFAYVFVCNPLKEGDVDDEDDD
jgi:hypothetical protein